MLGILVLVVVPLGIEVVVVVSGATVVVPGVVVVIVPSPEN